MIIELSNGLEWHGNTSVVNKAVQNRVQNPNHVQIYNKKKKKKKKNSGFNGTQQ